jgi:hypothetical protein
MAFADVMLGARPELTFYERALTVKAQIASLIDDTSLRGASPGVPDVDPEVLARRALAEAIVEFVRLVTLLLQRWNLIRQPIEACPPLAPPPRAHLPYDPWAQYGVITPASMSSSFPTSPPPERAPVQCAPAVIDSPRMPEVSASSVACVAAAPLPSSPFPPTMETPRDSQMDIPPSDPSAAVTPRSTTVNALLVEPARVAVRRERRVVRPVGLEWLSAESMAPHTTSIVASAHRGCLAVWCARQHAPALWRDAIDAAATERPSAPRRRLEVLAAMSTRMPRAELVESAIDDSLGVVGRWASEIDDGDVDGHLAALDALDALAASGVDARGRLYEAAAEAWFARTVRPAPSRGMHDLLATTATRLVDSLHRAAVPRARLYARILVTAAPWVHPDPAARIEWFARSVAEPLRVGKMDVDPVRHVFTPCVSEWFTALPVLPVARVAELFAAFTLADLERCIDVRTYDDCSRALLLRHGVEADALANIVRSPPELATHGGRGQAVPGPSVTRLVKTIPSTPAVTGHLSREHSCARTRAACEMIAPHRGSRSVRRTRCESRWSARLFLPTNCDHT